MAGGWRGLRLQDVADGIGVSRQTLYNEFTSKQGLAAALVLRRTEEFLAGLEAALEGEDDLYRAWAGAVRTTLDTVGRDPLLRVLLTGQGVEDLLPLPTSEAQLRGLGVHDDGAAHGGAVRGTDVSECPRLVEGVLKAERRGVIAGVPRLGR